MSFIQLIKDTSPKSYHYFELYYLEKRQKDITLEIFEKLPFCFQLGVFMNFFNGVNTDVDIFSNEEKALQESIKESFAQYEEYLFLDS